MLVVTARPGGAKDVAYRTISRPLVEALGRLELGTGHVDIGRLSVAYMQGPRAEGVAKPTATPAQLTERTFRRAAADSLARGQIAALRERITAMGLHPAPS